MGELSVLIWLVGAAVVVGALNAVLLTVILVAALGKAGEAGAPWRSGSGGGKGRKRFWG